LFPHFLDVTQRRKVFVCNAFDDKSTTLCLLSQSRCGHATGWKGNFRSLFEPQRSVRTDFVH